MSIPSNHPAIVQARALGLIVEDRPAKATKAKRTRTRKPLVEPGMVALRTWHVAIETKNESNAREWKARNRRAGAAWRAVRAAIRLSDLVPIAALARGGHVVTAKFTRLGGRRLDSLVNLPSALKGCEDAFCYLLGIDDGSPQWRPTCDQEPDSELMGVRVEIEVEK